MAGGVDITAAGGNPPSSGGLKPLVAALDKYQQQLSAVSRALEEAAALAGTTTAGGVTSTTTTIVQKAQPPSVPLPQPKVDPRYNPDLDYALGIGPKPEPPAPVAAPVLPEAPVAPQLPQPVLPEAPVAPQLPQPVLLEAPVAAAVTEEKTAAPKDESKADPISGVMDQFGEVFKGIGAELKTSLMTLSGIFNTVGVEAKLLAIAAESVAIALEPVEDVFDALSDAVRPIAEAFKVLLSVALAPIVGVLKVFGSLLKLLTSILKPVIAIVNGFGMIVDAIAEVIESIGTPMEIVAIQIEMIAEVFASIFGNVATIAKSMKAPQVAIQDSFKNVKSTIADLLVNPMGAIPDLMSRIREAVETFNPGGMIEFDLAMRDLMAVFGEALLPVVKTVTGVIRKFADTLRPILQTLAPAFQQLIDSIGNMLLGNIDKFAALLERMIPAFEMYLNQVIDAVNRQNAIADQSKENNSTLLDIGSWLSNWGRTTAQIQQSTKDWAGSKDSIQTIIKDSLGKQEDVKKQIVAIPQYQQKLKDSGKETKEGAESSAATLRMLEASVALSDMRDVFKASKAAGKKEDAVVGEGGKMEADVKAAFSNYEKVKSGRVSGKTTEAEVVKAMNEVAEAQLSAVGKMKEFVETKEPKKEDVKGAAQGLAAAQNPAFKSIADLSRDTILKAFTATSSEAQMKEKQNQRAVNNVADLPNIIVQGVQAGMAIAMKDAQQQAPAQAQAPAFPSPQVA